MLSGFLIDKGLEKDQAEQGGYSLLCIVNGAVDR
jgi:hypothetical protein